MKKLYILFFVITFSNILVLKSQNVYWLEDFEGSTSSWAVDAGTWEIGQPTSGPNSGHLSTNCSATVLAGNYSEGVNSRLISPMITIPASDQNPRLRFWQWYNFNAGDTGMVQIKVVGTSTWGKISTEYFHTGSGVWSYPSIDLSSYAGQVVQIAFFFHSQQVGPFGNTSTGWYIDDVSIVTGPLVFDNPETWEDGIGDWYVDKGTWEVGTPTAGPGSVHSGTKCAGTVLTGNYDESVNSRLISQATTIPASDQNPRLRFWQWYNFNAGDTGMVQIKVVGTSTWGKISTEYFHTGSGVWSYPSIDLSSYAGQVVQIAFFFHSQQVGPFGNTSTGWYIDDVSIVTGPLVFDNPETWEDGIGDWYVDKGTWEVGTPTAGPGSVHSGTKCAGTVLTGNYDESVNSRLISPVITIPDFNQYPNLRFWQWYNFNAGDTGTVQIKVVGTSKWENISIGYTGTSSGVWSSPYIDLSSYAGKVVQIAFFFHSQQVGSFGNTSTGWYIDDLAIQFTVGTQDLMLSEGPLHIYPNPANNILFFKGLKENTKVTVIDLQGKVILYKDVLDNLIDISILDEGIYTIIFKNETGITTRKFIKR
jgi:bacillopeptidase F (M6 metalloprotease family)